MKQGFDEYWENECIGITCDYPSEAARDAYEAGAQSRQAEIDELRGLFKSVAGDDLEEINRLKSVIDGMVNEIDAWKDEYRIATLRYEKLQKRVNEISTYIDQSKSVSMRAYNDINKIIKGKENE